MPTLRKIATFLTLIALSAPIAACGDGDGDVEREVNQAQQNIQEKANELEGNLDDLSKQDLQEALRDVEGSAKSGGEDAKREARELEQKIERELEQRK